MLSVKTVSDHRHIKMHLTDLQDLFNLVTVKFLTLSFLSLEFY